MAIAFCFVLSSLTHPNLNKRVIFDVDMEKKRRVPVLCKMIKYETANIFAPRMEYNLRDQIAYVCQLTRFEFFFMASWWSLALRLHGG